MALSCTPAPNCPLMTAGSKGGRNTSIFEERWSVQDGVSRTDLFHGEAEGGDLGSLAARGVDEVDRPEVRSQLLFDLSFVGQDGWHPSVGAPKISSGADGCRTRGDFARSESAAVLLRHRSSITACAVDDQPRGAAWERALRPKSCKLACRPALCRTVSVKLERKWSPQQIAGWLKRKYPDNEHACVSHETIYRSLFIQTRGVLKKELLAHLRATRAIRRSRHASLKCDGLGQIKDAISIRERPAAVEDRAIPGHWEGDLIAGSKNSYIATLVERHSRYVLLAKVANKDIASVVTALVRQVQHLPRELRRSLTWDRGKELADHKRLTLATDLEVYFCDPHSPWQRGTNENTNRLLRQYFPKATDLSVHSQAKLNAVARELNERPRKTLQYHSPAEKFAECVATIG